MKTYQSFAKTSNTGQLINTEIKAKNIKSAKIWFDENTIEHERVYLKK
jgi:hypothetical protein